MNQTNEIKPPVVYPDNFDNKAGSAFFGIDSKYLVNVQKKEIYYLVGYGFDFQSLMNMSIEERRYYFHLYLEQKEQENSVHNE